MANLLYQARELAEQLMAQHGLTGWRFVFNKTKDAAGRCCYPRGGGPGRIELSVHYVHFNPIDKVRGTILHEIAHALTPGHNHDAVWRAKCVEIGAEPKRCYDSEDVVMPVGKWRATCGGCQKTHNMHRKPKRLTGWFCRTCGKDKGKLVWRSA